jgi:hypothetical protein
VAKVSFVYPATLIFGAQAVLQVLVSGSPSPEITTMVVQNLFQKMREQFIFVNLLNTR